MNSIRLFNDNWYFSKHPLYTGLAKINEPEILWEPVSLPHDWLIYDTGNLYEDGEGWYKKAYEIAEPRPDTLTVLRFEGVYMNCSVYVNNSLAGSWKYGYSTFEIDISRYLAAGTNLILVQVMHESPNSRWYSGAGIYRNVWLKTRPSTHLASDGIYISAKQEGTEWLVDITTEISLGAQNTPDGLELRQWIADEEGQIIARSESPILSGHKGTGIINDDMLLTTCHQLKVSNPRLWDISSPVLYRLNTRLISAGRVIGWEHQTFGFRSIAFDSQKGFFLNGSPLKLYGVCQHHDLGCLGAAVNRTALKRQLLILKSMGANAIRTAHNMPAVELMELADEMGFLIVSEAFDMWERKKTAYDYSRFFNEWAPRDVASWIRRDRNHPSVIMWSIGNEIYDTHADERGQELTRWLMGLVKEHDPRGNAPVTIGSNYMPWENARKCADIVKLAGYNYAERYYDKHHKEHPDWIIYGSETSSTVQSRGIYHFPLAQPVLSDDDEQCSSLGNSSTSWGAKNTEQCIIDDRDAPYSLGQFIWSGFDYIGEPTPYHTKNSYFGQIDTAGFPKDSYYIYRAEWTSYKEYPMIHIFPYWDFSEGQLIDIRVCSNAPKIELFFNDISQGVYLIDHAHGDRLLGEWQLPYSRGVLRAVAYDEEDTIIAEEIKSSFGDAAALVLTPDKKEVSADGQDLVFIEVSAVDHQGLPVENANNRVHITLEGPGCLLGLDNGDSTDYDQYKGTSRRMFSGKLLAVVSGTFSPGEITIVAESPGLASARMTVNAIPAPVTPGSCEPMDFRTRGKTTGYAGTSSDGVPRDNKEPSVHNAGRASADNSAEIPIRKLEILCPQGNKLTKDMPALTAQAIIHPASATYRDIQWRITNVAGIDTNIAALNAKGTAAEITALGDGTVYLRCSAKNGADKVKLYSQMEISITGIGSASLNPYAFVSAGLYSYGSDNLTNGNERGIATARDGRSVISFEHLDFGDFGSDELVLPVFSLDHEEFPIEIWEGIPDRTNAALLTTVLYGKPSIWNVYQEETYKLPKRLKGLTALSFVLHRKIHLKGFSFTRYDKAYMRLSSLDYTHIYGDSYTLKEDSIEEIGNNVSIVFDHMDFGDKGADRLILCGHTPLDRNTVHVRFHGPEGDRMEILEFPYSDGYTEREFSLPAVTGEQTVTFVFLPGCQFDFQWFHFQ